MALLLQRLVRQLARFSRRAEDESNGFLRLAATGWALRPGTPNPNNAHAVTCLLSGQAPVLWWPVLISGFPDPTSSGRAEFLVSFLRISLRSRHNQMPPRAFLLRQSGMWLSPDALRG